MTEQGNEYKKDSYLRELEQLRTFKRLFDSDDGKLFIQFVLNESKIKEEPHSASKNSGEVAYLLGKQCVGRAVVDKLIQAGVNINGSIFSNKSKDRMAFITKELNNLIGGK